MLSPGCVSYHLSMRVAPRQPSSDKSPSIVKRPVAREMRIGSPASGDCAAPCAGMPSVEPNTIAANHLDGTEVVVLYNFAIADRPIADRMCLPRAPRLRLARPLLVESPAGRERTLCEPFR